MLLLIGLENLGVRTGLRAHRRGQYRPAIVLLQVAQGFDVHDETLARLRRGWVRLRWASPSSAAHAAGVRDNVIAYRMIPPRAGAATSAARPSVLIFRDGSCRISLTSKPLSLHMLHMVCDGLSFLALRSGIRLSLLLGQLIRMHHDKPEFLHGDPPITILHLHLPDDALSMPAAGCFCLRPSRFLHQQGQGSLLLPPGFEGLPDSTGARN